MTETPDPAELTAFFDSYSAAWQANDPAAIEAHWDTADPKPLYKAEEITHVIEDWPALRAYWAHNEGFHQMVWLRFREPQVKPLAPGLVMVAVRMRWDIHFAEGTKTMDGHGFPFAGTAMGGDNHVITLLRHSGDGWKLTAWSETPDAPITYMGQLYQKDLSPGFPPAV